MFNKGPQDQKYTLVAEHLPSTCEARVQIPSDTEMDIVEWMLLLASRVVHACNLTPWEMKMKESVQDIPWLHSHCEGSLGYTRSCLNE